MIAAQGPEVAFEPLRPRLTRVAYRMLGSVAEAEDVVQEAFIRWHNTDRSRVTDPTGFLVTTVTRLSLDVLKSARRRRETYPGPWLPEPVVEPEAEALEDDVTLPLLLALERLSPLERAAFLLHDVFGMSFDQVAAAIGKEPAACRQLASRARTHVREERPRFPVERDQGMKIAEAFYAASRNGEMADLQALLAADVRVVSDGGGKRPAAMEPIVGRDAVVALHEGMARLFAKVGRDLIRFAMINGLPGFVTREADGMIQTTALEIEDGRVVRSIW